MENPNSVVWEYYGPIKHENSLRPETQVDIAI